jgi:hypothetical protein
MIFLYLLGVGIAYLFGGARSRETEEAGTEAGTEA